MTSEKPKRGRPRKPPTVAYSVKLQADLVEQCKLAARLEGLTLTEWVAEAMRQRYDAIAERGDTLRLAKRKKTKPPTDKE